MAEEQKTRSGWDVMGEALQLIVRAAGASVESVTPEQILKVDNELRAKYGMRQLKKYPVFEKEFKPSEKKAYFQKLTGATITREKGKLPIITPVFEECDGYDAITDLEGHKSKVNDLLAELFPNGGMITPAMRKAALESVVQREQLAATGEIVGEVEAPKTAEVDNSGQRKPGRSKGS